MVINRTIAEYAKTSIYALGSSITRPTGNANNFEIKTQVIQMIENSCPFHEHPDEDPHVHIANFLETIDTFKVNDVVN